MDIYLIRHGEAAASWGEDPDPGLSELGHEQAQTAADELLRNVTADFQLVSSPLARARETSEPLATQLNLPVDIQDVFREVPSPVPLEQRQGWLRQFMAQQWHEQEESLLTWRNAIIERLLACEQPCAVFTHFLVINAVVGSVLERPETLCCWPDNGSITHLRSVDGQLQLAALGKQIETHVN